MITRQDIEDMGYEYYTTSTPESNSIMDMVQEFAKVTGQVVDAKLYERLILEEFSELWDELEEEHRDYQPLNAPAALKELSDLVYVIFGYANANGWDLMEAVRRVHVNNLGRCVQDDGSVQRRADGKILKRGDYPKVDLSNLV